MGNESLDKSSQTYKEEGPIQTCTGVLGGTVVGGQLVSTLSLNYVFNLGQTVGTKSTTKFRWYFKGPLGLVHNPTTDGPHKGRKVYRRIQVQ